MSKGLLQRFADAETGAVAIEYGLIATLIAVSLIPALDATGLAIHGLFEDIAGRIIGR